MVAVWAERVDADAALLIAHRLVPLRSGRAPALRHRGTGTGAWRRREQHGASSKGKRRDIVARNKDRRGIYSYRTRSSIKKYLARGKHMAASRISAAWALGAWWIATHHQACGNVARCISRKVNRLQAKYRG